MNGTDRSRTDDLLRVNRVLAKSSGPFCFPEIESHQNPILLGETWTVSVWRLSLPNPSHARPEPQVRRGDVDRNVYRIWQVSV
jgi:hypothetical protein